MTSGAGMVDQVADYAIIALSPDGIVQSWNAGAQALEGYAADEVMGRHFSLFYTPEDRDAALPMRILEQAQVAGSFEATGWRVRRDGSRFWANTVITALHTGDDLSGFVKVTRDVTASYRAERELRQANDRLRLLMNSVVDYAIIALDKYGTVESWNAGAERLKGYTADEIVGQHFSVFYTAEDRRSGQPRLFLDQALAHGSYEHTGWRVRKDGSQFWGDVVITAIHDDAGKLTGYVKITRDLSERKQLEAAQDSFYNTFEHDFRIPIAAIKGFTEVIREADRDDQDRFLQRVDANAELLLRMIEELVDYARVRSGRIPIRLEVVDLGKLVADVVKNMVLPADRVSITTAPVKVLADSAALHRVTSNLLNNALKYSPADSVIALRVEQDGDQGVLSVEDKGRGIDSRDVETIFNEFERGRLALQDGGTGLGLASARQLIRLQGGTIGIDSAVGTGTTVTIHLPRQLTMLPAPSPAPAPQQHSEVFPGL